MRFISQQNDTICSENKWIQEVFALRMRSVVLNQTQRLRLIWLWLNKRTLRQGKGHSWLSHGEMWTQLFKTSLSFSVRDSPSCLLSPSPFHWEKKVQVIVKNDNCIDLLTPADLFISPLKSWLCSYLVCCLIPIRFQIWMAIKYPNLDN